MADEASDSSNKEQLSLVLRFVDENLEIREEFLGFKECESGTSGEALSKMITDCITKMITDCITKDWGLNIEFLCAQAYGCFQDH